MPIPVLCDNCQTRLNAPDAAAGKKVKCPKCQAVMAVPAAAAPEPPPVPSRPPAPAASGTPFDFGAAPPQPSGEPRPATPPEPPAPPPPTSAGGAFNFGAAVSSADPARGRGERGRDRADRGERGERERGERGDRERRRRDDDAPPDRGDRPRRPRPRDEDDLEDDDHTRGRGGPRKKGPSLALILLGGGFILLTCCGGGGVGLYYAVDRIRTAAQDARARNDTLEKRLADEKKRQNDGDDASGGGKVAVPAGWREFRKDGFVKAYFPGPVRDGAVAFRSATVQSVRTFEHTESFGVSKYVVAVVKFTPATSAADRDRELVRVAALVDTLGQGDAVPARTVRWLGEPGKETEAATGPDAPVAVTRRVIVGDTGYVGSVVHRGKADTAAAFFAHVEPLSK